MVEKYGEEGAREIQRRNFFQASQAGKGNKGKPKSEEHRKKTSEAMRKYNAKRKLTKG
jgi:hypothetical protein